MILMYPENVTGLLEEILIQITEWVETVEERMESESLAFLSILIVIYPLPS